MRHRYGTVTHSARVVAQLSGVAERFIDASLQPTDRHKDIWDFHSKELWTPLGLPLQVSVAIGVKNYVRIWTVKTKLLEAGAVDLSIHIDLLLPTEERLTIWTEESRLSAPGAR